MTKSNLKKTGTGLLLLITLTVFLIWSAWFDIDQFVRASGQVIPQEKTQLIQVADGGVLKELNVSEGEKVHKGQVLAMLEDERARAGMDEVRNRIAGLEITRSRAQAEASGEKFQSHRHQQSHPDLVKTQVALYSQNTETINKELIALENQLNLTAEEFSLVDQLYQSGNISRVELMRTQRMVLEISQKIQATKDRFKSDARKELARIEDEITSQRSKLQERQSIYDHTTLVAPTDGIIKYLRVNTLGGVMRPGDELMQISPTEGQYIVEAKINPSDIGQLIVGQKATLRIDTFDYSIYGTLQGQLNYLSSDTLSEIGPDGRTNQTYYRAKISIEIPAGSRILKSDIKPGMTVTIDLQSKPRSVLHYIIKPIIRAFNGALSQK